MEHPASRGFWGASVGRFEGAAGGGCWERALPCWERKPSADL
ncbi:hypothetical protein TERTU_1397 [Teredinibacter turnerae T7901]|uniref:Uncharacterized protein n=1 Tax=Teredinibacter turnerae (strain ATCC 39867 / T7901) TaxID=377629 RepID=C5BSK3_TERTT|nr:hypothetical protein TERTU_1397 [Teredinibacter turnerae T7901]